VDYDFGACAPHGRRHGARVEQVNESGFDADGGQIVHLLRRARRPDNIMSVLHEQLHQPSADGSGRPDHENPHAFCIDLVNIIPLVNRRSFEFCAAHPRGCVSTDPRASRRLRGRTHRPMRRTPSN